MAHLKARLAKAAICSAAILLSPAVISVVPARADSATQAMIAKPQTSNYELAMARDLLASTDTKGQLEAQFPKLSDDLARAIQANPMLRNARIDARNMALGLFRQNEQAMLGDMAVIYAGVFSTDDMKSLSAFWRTPAGAKFQQFSKAFAADRDPDRKKAGDAASALVGLTASDKAEIGAYLKTAEWHKMMKAGPVLSAALFEVGRIWGIRIANVIVAKAKQSLASKDEGRA